MSEDKELLELINALQELEDSIEATIKNLEEISKEIRELS